MSFPPGTEMFQFPGFASLPLCIQDEDTWSASPSTSPRRGKTTAKHQVGCPIRKSMDQSSFSAPHGLSQSITSFIASCCQGIHQTPLSRLIRSREGKARLLRLRPAQRPKPAVADPGHPWSEVIHFPAPSSPCKALGSNG